MSEDEEETLDLVTNILDGNVQFRWAASRGPKGKRFDGGDEQPCEAV